MIRNLIFSVFIFALVIPATTQDLIYYEKIGSTTKAELIEKYTLGIFEYDVDHYAIHYTTPDVHGVLDTASGLISIPKGDNVFPLLCYQHGTVGEKMDVPSRLGGGFQIAEVCASLGYTVFAPDFLGLGESRGFHPYVHRASEASAALDMMTVTKQFLGTIGAHINEQLFLTGYSQGGHAALALQKELEEKHPDVSITASAPMSGPYSMSGVMNNFMLSEEPYGFVAYLPYVILSYQTVYGNLFENVEDVFKPQYASAIKAFYEGKKTLNVLNSELSAKLTEAHGAPIPTKLFQDSIITNFANNPAHPLQVALKDNDVYDWAPQIPTRLLYCKGDDQVSYINSVVADSVMNANGAPDVTSIDLDSNLNHGQCVRPAVIGAYFFFRQYQRIDTYTHNSDVAATDIKIYPNPANLYITISGVKNQDYFRMYGIDGQLVMEKKRLSDTQTIDVQLLPKGIYTVQIISDNNLHTRKLVLR